MGNLLLKVRNDNALRAEKLPSAVDLAKNHRNVKPRLLSGNAYG
jgi:hypothetical protein